MNYMKVIRVGFFGVLASVEECDFTTVGIDMQDSLQISGAKHKLFTYVTCENKRKGYPLRRTKPNI